MAGTIFIDGELWSAAGCLFDFVVAQAADSVSSEQLAARLREVVDEHPGALSIGDLSPDDRDAVLAALGPALLERAAARLPSDLPKRESVLSLVSELVVLAERGNRNR